MAAQDLCSLADVRAALEIPGPDTSRDTLIQTLITAASDALMEETEREFAPSTASATRRFRIENFAMSLAPYDLRTVSSFILHPEGSSPVTLDTTQYNLEPVTTKTGTYTSVQFSTYLAALPSSQTAFAYGYALCDITGAWGFTSVPTDVNRACVVTVASWMRKDVSALIAASELDIGGGIAPAFPSTMEIPNAAKRLLRPYYRLGSFVPC